MSSTVSLPPASPISRLRSVITVILGTILFLVIVGIASKGLRLLLEGHVATTLRARTTLAISGSALGEIIVLILLVLFLGLRGRSLRELGLWHSSPLHGWIVAAVFSVLYLGMTLAGLRGHAALTEGSAFHIYNSLAAGITAGFIEEMFFRGFVMNELKWSGFGATVQIIASGVLFGIAHVGWGLFAAKVNWPALLGSVTATTVIGFFYAIAYVASRRSLMPVIVGHLVVDVLIEPWLVLTALAGTMAHAH
ncbi:MAG: CPBP family intramembrane glutamic endopeptidase [Candidatus Sulfotelmatobacter sp.]